MSWHDVHVHGFRLESFVEDEGCANLILEIDYILEWRESPGGFEFNLASAELCFHKVSGPRFEVDYATRSAGMCPFSIDGVERQAVTHPTGYESFRWQIPVNWPAGALQFEAPGFSMTLKGTPRVQDRQWLVRGRDDGSS